jgi:hypothetical protein
MRTLTCTCDYKVCWVLCCLHPAPPCAVHGSCGCKIVCEKQRVSICPCKASGTRVVRARPGGGGGAGRVPARTQERAHVRCSPRRGSTGVLCSRPHASGLPARCSTVACLTCVHPQKRCEDCHVIFSNVKGLTAGCGRDALCLFDSNVKLGSAACRGTARAARAQRVQQRRGLPQVPGAAYSLLATLSAASHTHHCQVCGSMHASFCFNATLCATGMLAVIPRASPHRSQNSIACLPW